ncbi:MAG TPA: glycerol-3-phosphate dehydrogenase [Candidatus Marinimicrobia bacterium]|nr:glycerol-3-phosphate dehydrogenase [Candidatus Neomarinimicrobiota bacterium]
MSVIILKIVKFEKNGASMKFSGKSRQETLAHSGEKIWDILIIGGGITGAGAAMAAARRGYKTLILEKDDFASGTSSRSSKMIHGGLRYLQQMNISLVRESLSEREILLQIAPHQVYPQEYVYPVYEYSKNNKFEIKIGLIGYDLLAGSRQIGHHRMISPARLAKLEPEINQSQMTGAFIYFDCLVDDGRLTLAAMQSAAAMGAAIANYAEVRSLQLNDSYVTAEVRDSINGAVYKVKSRLIINATGPWTDHMRHKLQKSDKLLRPTKGIHIVFKKERLPLNRSVVLFSEDGRMIFSVPKGKYTYIGTTDTDYSGDPDDVFASEEDIDYLLAAANRAFNKGKLSRADIVSSWAGLRPLIGGEEGDPSDISRDFEIIQDHPRFLTVAGGKLTTFRLMGEKTIDRAEKSLPLELHRSEEEALHPESLPLFGGNIRDIILFKEINSKLYSDLWNLPPETIQRLIGMYGTQFTLLSQYGKENLKPLVSGADILKAEIHYLIDYEMTLTLEDLMWRRLSLLIFDDTNGLFMVEAIANEMAQKLNWSSEKQKNELEHYRSLVKKNFGCGIKNG